MNAPDLFNPLEGLQSAGQRLFDLWKQVEAFLSGPEGVRWFVLLLGLWTFGELTTRLMRRRRERQRRLRGERAHQQALDLMSRAMLGYRVAIFVQTFTLGEVFHFVFELEGLGGRERLAQAGIAMQALERLPAAEPRLAPAG